MKREWNCADREQQYMHEQCCFVCVYFRGHSGHLCKESSVRKSLCRYTLALILLVCINGVTYYVPLYGVLLVMLVSPLLHPVPRDRSPFSNERDSPPGFPEGQLGNILPAARCAEASASAHLVK